MSEFECINGHLMAPSHGPFCMECGGRVHRMDGLTNNQLRMLEKMEEQEGGEEEEELELEDEEEEEPKD